SPPLCPGVASPAKPSFRAKQADFFLPPSSLANASACVGEESLLAFAEAVFSPAFWTLFATRHSPLATAFLRFRRSSRPQAPRRRQPPPRAYRPRKYRKREASHRPENFLDALSIFGPPVRRYSEGRSTGPPEGHYRRLHAAIFGC